MPLSQPPNAEYAKRVYTLWPHLKEMPAPAEGHWNPWFYQFTYGFGDDSWESRIEEGADEDESRRICWAFKVALENRFDGKDGRPTLARFWQDLHQRVVCPLFKKALSEDL